MPGIHDLTEIYTRRGEWFVQNLFNSSVTVSEKLAGSAFSAHWDGESFTFYKRNSQTPITKIERTLMSYYEDGIRFFESIPSKTLRKLTPGMRIGCEYFVTTAPNFLVYDQEPKNKFVLTHIKMYNGAGVITEVVDDFPTLSKWASLLQIDPPPILFQGFLNDDQKDRILTYLATPPSQIKEKFGTESFARFVISTLTPGKTRSTLQLTLDKPIEGIIFQFGVGEGKTQLAQLIDPIFKEIQKRSEEDIEATQTRNDILDLTLINFVEFLETEKIFRGIKLNKSSLEERYLELMSALFNKFMGIKGKEYEGANFNPPSFMKKAEFQLNPSFIENPETLAYLERSTTNQELFKIFLAFYRKKRRKAEGLLTSDILKNQNDQVDMIADFLNKGMTDDLLTLKEWSAVFKFMDDPEVSPISEDTPFLEEDDEAFTSIYEETKKNAPVKLNSMELISVCQKMFARSKRKGPSKKVNGKVREKVNVLVGRFQPFHNGHAEICNEMQDKYKRPTVIIQILGDGKRETRPITEKVAIRMLETIKETFPQVKDYIQMERYKFRAIVEQLREQGYEPVMFSASEDLAPLIEKSIEYEDYRGEMELSKDFQVMEYRKGGTKNREIRGRSVREAIQKNDYRKFKELVPKSLWPQFGEFQESIKNFRPK